MISKVCLIAAGILALLALVGADVFGLSAIKELALGLGLVVLAALL